MMMRSLIIIPAYNEASTIAHVVEGCSQYCDVLVIDDGSLDETLKESKEAGALVISNEINKGYECSLNIGYTYALAQNYDLMITMDADGQLPSNSIPKFINAIEDGACLAVGRRENIPRLCEKFLSYSSSHLSYILDPYCGMKSYNLKALKRDTFSTYESIGTSLAFDYIEQRLKCENIDIDINEREGKSKFGGKLVSEFRLFRSMAVGNYRLLKNWIKWKGTNNANV